ncbi:MAG: E3 binding domain-containing protein, partial [Calditrichaeota bacterium]|nr:E3 binding domain-containing protein [Calditrichota bacterium]
MKQDVKVPAVGESISEVTIAHWLKKDGDIVEADDLICEIESDKASFEIPAESGGVLKILAGEGDTIEIGAKIAEIDTDGATGNNKPAPESKETAESKPAQSSEQSSQKPESELASTESFTVVVPTVGESISEVTIAQWLKPDGAQIEVDDLICEIESDKASFEIPAEASGTLKHLVNEGDTVEIGAAIAEIGGSGSKSSDARPAQKAPESTAESSNGATGDDRKVKISPVAANMLNEAGISPQTVAGSGPGGKITKKKKKKALDKPQQP